MSNIRETVRQENSRSQVHFRAVDLSRQRDVKRFAREIGEEFNRISILVNNAGIIGDIGHKVLCVLIITINCNGM